MNFSFTGRWIATLSLACAFVAISQANASAQTAGYQFGVGLGYGQPGGIRFISPREDLPYFAKYPPVYYGDMVRRPYGYSPYALPPGIMPVEAAVIAQAHQPQTIMNPFFVPNAAAEHPVQERQSELPNLTVPGSTDLEAPAIPQAEPATPESIPTAPRVPDDGDDIAQHG